MRQDVAAGVHRLMLTTLLSEARRVWVAIPAWADVLRPWALRRSDLSFLWLPVPCTLPIAEAPAEVQRIRAQRLEAGEILVGHFSTYQPAIRHSLCQLLPLLLRKLPEIRIELLGRGGAAVADQLRARLGADAARVAAAGDLGATQLSLRLQACDLLVQPYPDGASTRRTTLMAAMAHGLPVATTAGRLSEPFWQECDGVAVAPAGDLAALSALAEDLVRHPARRRDMGLRARALYERRFSLARVIDALRTEACGAVC
jgi:glycosyltransferase involved in cell wall biosynthesis